MTDSNNTDTASASGSNEKSTPVSAVALKLPQFWPQDPEVWFAQVEAQFATRGITAEKTKYSHVVAALSPQYALEVRDLIINPPKQTPYTSFKAELIKRTSESEQKRLQQLLRTEELGDRKPTQLLRRMRQLLGERTLGDSLMKQLFLQRLPTNTQLILASMGDASTVEQLAITADKIAEVHHEPASSTIAAVSTQPAGATASHSDRSDLEAQIASLTKQVESLTRQLSDKPPARHSRGRHQTKSDPAKQKRRRSRSNSPHAGEQCWYHWRWGDQARICIPPCSFSSSNSNASK